MGEIEIEDPLLEIPEFNLSNWKIEESYIENNKLSFTDFFNNFMLGNLPCIIRNVANDWECARKWVKLDQINYEYISKMYGDLDAPVADCNNIQFNSHCKINMKVDAYMEYLKCQNENKILYLKDWHLKRSKPDDLFYKVPIYFALDWLNEFATDKKEDDFMFVYIGPRGSWTPLHEDVYCSYSWSVNVVGRKKWILLPPGEENKLKDTFDNLPLIFEADKYEDVKYYEIIQEQGDAIYVPSGWHHQVFNELHTISVNHNWINSCNIHTVWQALQNCLLKVEHQIEEFRDTPEFASQCQLILKSLFGMDFKSFANFLCYIAKKRLTQLQGGSRIGLGDYSLGINTIKFDLNHILKVLNSIYTHPVTVNKDILSQIELADFINIKNAIAQAL